MWVQSKLPTKGLLWELIHPQDSSGHPATSASGKYDVKCFVMHEWRRVTVDDRIPVDMFGAPLLVGSMPPRLWPLILSKAVIKIMALYQVCPLFCVCCLASLETVVHLLCSTSAEVSLVCVHTISSLLGPLASQVY